MSKENPSSSSSGDSEQQNLIEEIELEISDIELNFD